MLTSFEVFNPYHKRITTKKNLATNATKKAIYYFIAFEQLLVVN